MSSSLSLPWSSFVGIVRGGGGGGVVVVVVGVGVVDVVGVVGDVRVVCVVCVGVGVACVCRRGELRIMRSICRCVRFNRFSSSVVRVQVALPYSTVGVTLP